MKFFTFLEWWSEEQLNSTINWFCPQPLNKIPDQAKEREVMDFDNHMRVCDLQRLEDAHPIISDVDDRQQTIRQQSCENKELLHFCFTDNNLSVMLHRHVI